MNFVDIAVSFVRVAKGLAKTGIGTQVTPTQLSLRSAMVFGLNGQCHRTFSPDGVPALVIVATSDGIQNSVTGIIHGD